MTIETIQIKSEEQWLRERLLDITSTEVSALFDLSPYRTEFELYHEKRDGQLIKFKENARMKWGKRFEAPIAYGVAEDEGWNIEKFDVYMRDVPARMGSSFDFKIKSQSDGDGILEIKNVDALAYKRSWIDDGVTIEAPEHIELQIQHQMEVSGLKWCALVAMVGGNTPKIVYRQHDQVIGKKIRAKVAEFWQRVADGIPPSADYTKDADLIAQLYSQANDGEVFDATGDENIARLVAQYQSAAAQIKQYETMQASYKAQLLERIGTASKVVGKWGSIACGKVKDSPAKIITADMVGKETGGRKGYRMFNLTWKETANV